MKISTILKPALLVAAVSVMCMSCGRHKTHIMELETQLDSVQAVSNQQQYVIEDMTAVVAELAAVMDTIRMQEQILTLKVDENGKPLSRKRILENLALLEDILQEKRGRIAVLDSLLNTRTDQVRQLSALVSHLYDEIDQKEETIKRLQTELNTTRRELARKKEEITTLNANVNELSGEVSDLKVRQEETERENSELKGKVEASKLVYYIVGTQVELKNLGVLKAKGLSYVVDATNLDLSRFTCERIDEFESLSFMGKKPKIMSTMPEGSYYLYDGEGKSNSRLQITDAERFWSLTKILVIQVR